VTTSFHRHLDDRQEERREDDADCGCEARNRLRNKKVHCRSQSCCRTAAGPVYENLTSDLFPTLNTKSLTPRMNNERASLSVSVVDSLTASVRVIAPDRPGLMRDITRALTSQGFFIDSATVSTKDGETADNTFTIKLEKKDTTLCDSWKDFTYV
jgi:hypothetical protein